MIDKEAADDMLDALEARVKATPSKLDDIAVLSVISAIRIIVGIPDRE